MRFKIAGLFLLVAGAAGAAGVGLAQDKPLQASPPPKVEAVDPAAQKIAQALIEQVLKLSHAQEIFDSLRRTLRDVYIPTMRGLIQGDFPGAPEADAASASAMAKLLTLMDYVAKAGDELDAAFSKNRNAMISDFAAQLAKEVDTSELGDVRRLLDLPVTRKTMDALYATSKLVTGFNYEDSRIFSEFSAWVRGLDFDITRALPGNQDTTKPVPSGAKIQKAQTFVTDFLRLSHLDEIAAAVEAFARDVYVEIAPATADEREKLRRDIDRYVFMYNLQKGVAIGVAPAIVSTSLTDAQLDKLIGYLHSPTFGKAFDLFRAAVASLTAYTKEDISGAQKALQDLDEKSKLRSLEQREKATQEWTALFDKWTEKLKDTLSPETRQGLEQSLDDLQLREAPM